MEIEARMTQLVEEKRPTPQIIDILNREGYKTPRGRRINPIFLRNLKQKLKGRNERKKSKPPSSSTPTSLISTILNSDLSNEKKIELLKIIL